MNENSIHSRELKLDDDDDYGDYNDMNLYYNEFKNNNNNNNNNKEYDDIDNRSIRKEVLTYINSDIIIEKTLKKAFKQNVTSRQPLSIAKSINDSIDMNSIASSGTHSLDMGYSIKSGTINSINNINNNQIIHNTVDDKQFLEICWRSFNKYGILQENGDSPFDCCKRGLSIQKLIPAMKDISHGINASLIEQIIEKYYSSKFYMLSWNEFKKLATEIITVDRENKRLSMLQSNDNINQNTYNNNLISTGSSIIASNSTPNLITTPSISIEPVYNKLLQKQRYASSFSSKNNLPQGVTNEFTHSLTDIGGQYIDRNTMNEAIIQSFKNESRLLRKEETESKQFSNHIPTAPTTPSGFIKDNDSDLSTKRFIQPLIKEKMQSIFNKKDNIHIKWEETKKKRDERILRENKRHVRADMISLWNRITFAEDKECINKRLATDKKIQDEIAKSRYYEQRGSEMAMKENIHRIKSEDMLRKSQSASTFKDALNSSMDLERETREETMAEMRSLRPYGYGRISEESSGIVAIPQEIKIKIKSAKRLTEYEAAKKEEKDYFNKTMAYRLSLISKKKSAAIKKAIQIGAPISLSPLKSDELLSDFSFDDTITEYHRRSRSYDKDMNYGDIGESAFELSNSLDSR